MLLVKKEKERIGGALLLLAGAFPYLIQALDWYGRAKDLTELLETINIHASHLIQGVFSVLFNNLLIIFGVLLILDSFFNFFKKAKDWFLDKLNISSSKEKVETIDYPDAVNMAYKSTLFNTAIEKFNRAEKFRNQTLSVGIGLASSIKNLPLALTNPQDVDSIIHKKARNWVKNKIDKALADKQLVFVSDSRLGKIKFESWLKTEELNEQALDDFIFAAL